MGGDPRTLSGRLNDILQPRVWLQARARRRGGRVKVIGSQDRACLDGNGTDKNPPRVWPQGQGGVERRRVRRGGWHFPHVPIPKAAAAAGGPRSLVSH